MKLLFLTSRLPYPPFQGDRLKIYHILRILSRKHDITLLSFVESEAEAKLVENLYPFCSKIETVVHSKSKSYLRLLLNIFSRVPFQVAYYQSPKFSEKLDNLLKTNNFDVIHTHLIRLVPYTVTSPIPRVLDLTDAISKYLKSRVDSTSNLILKAAIYLELRRMLKYEPVLHRFNAVSVCSEVDRDELLKTAPSSNISLIRNGLDTEYFKPDENAIVEPYSIVFTGNMSYPPNEDGIVYFSKNVLPLVHDVLPQAKLYIVGKSPSSKLQSLASESIIVTGKVDDIRDYYKKAQVAICPIRFGAGTLNKVIEPMAMRIPVVSTSIACQGMNVTPITDIQTPIPYDTDANIIFADSPTDFADALITLLNDPKLCRTIGSSGRRLVEREHDWEEIVAKLETIYFDIQHSNAHSIHSI
jgi:polysaccharide biosynthesis protein PslH